MYALPITYSTTRKGNAQFGLYFYAALVSVYLATDVWLNC